MNHKGVEYTVVSGETPGIWRWQFRIGDEVKTCLLYTSDAADE